MYIATTEDHVMMLAYIVQLETTPVIYIVAIHCPVRTCESPTRTMSTYVAVEIGHVLMQACHQQAQQTVHTPYKYSIGIYQTEERLEHYK